jgi:thiamine pyrophosphate-dependent acetolactate synthase large subunit-like protein
MPTHTETQIAAAISRIKSASKPTLLIGSGAIMNPKNANALQSAITTLGLPVYLSGMARGLLGKESNLQMRHHRKEAIKESDLIILAGVAKRFSFGLWQSHWRAAFHFN